MKILVYFFSIFLSLGAFAYESSEALSGYVGMGHSPPGDPLPNSPLVAYFTVEGKAAKRIYDNLAVKSITPGCDEGWYDKRVGNLVCTTDKKIYKCDFGIELKTGKKLIGIPC